MSDLFLQWTNATSKLPWGAQHAFHDVLTLASEGKVTLVYGADYNDKGACLVNQAGNLLAVGGGYGVPLSNFPEVVSLFDAINSHLRTEGVNEHYHRVSPMAAEILLHNFAPLKDIPANAEPPDPTITAERLEEWTYIEPTDEEFAAKIDVLLSQPGIPEMEVIAEQVAEYDNSSAEYEYARRKYEDEQD